MIIFAASPLNNGHHHHMPVSPHDLHTPVPNGTTWSKAIHSTTNVVVVSLSSPSSALGETSAASIIAITTAYSLVVVLGPQHKNKNKLPCTEWQVAFLLLANAAAAPSKAIHSTTNVVIVSLSTSSSALEEIPEPSIVTITTVDSLVVVLVRTILLI